MSFGLPSLKPENSVPDLGLKKSSDYGVHDTFKYGIRNVKSNVEVAHPLELSEKNYKIKEHQMQMSILRNMQGLHAPIKIGAEMWAAKQTGRLPFLESSNLSLATLSCADDSLDFTDFLSLPEVDERIVAPHVVMEHKLGIL